MAAVTAAGGEVLIQNVIPKHLDCITAKLVEMGAEVEEQDDAVLIRRTGPIHRTNIKTMPYPGFPTDMQSQIAAALCLAQGTSVITEGVWDNRYRYVDELRRMGAQIQVDGKVAVIEGVDHLTGAPVRACDLRAGAAMVIAGLAARGRTEVDHIYHIERGYEDIVRKLSAWGPTSVWWSSRTRRPRRPPRWAERPTRAAAMGPPPAFLYTGPFRENGEETCPLLTLHTLASGSSGNAMLVTDGTTHILLDAGISARRIAQALAQLGLRPGELAGVLITHEHTDHIAGLTTLTQAVPPARLGHPGHRTAAAPPHPLCRRAGPCRPRRGGVPAGHLRGAAVPHLPRRGGERWVSPHLLRGVTAAVATDLGYGHRRGAGRGAGRGHPGGGGQPRRGVGALRPALSLPPEAPHSGRPGPPVQRGGGGTDPPRRRRPGPASVVLAHLSAENNTPAHAEETVCRLLRDGGYPARCGRGPHGGAPGPAQRAVQVRGRAG